MNKEKDSAKRRSTFSILFYIERKKVKKNGKCVVFGRITIDKGISQFSIKQEIDPKIWDSKNGCALGKSKEAIKLNRMLSVIKQGACDAYIRILERQGFVSAELVKNNILGIGAKAFTLMALFREHNEEYKLRVGVNRVEATYKEYLYSYRMLSGFLKYKYDVEDVTLKSLKLPFIKAYDFYLRVERKLSPHSISGHTIYLKKMIRRAIKQGTLLIDPFVSYVPEQPERKCRHLTFDELKKLMYADIEVDALRHTRDMFIFSCFCGLSYSDLKNLSEEHLVYKPDGSIWIYINRQKTGTESVIKLLDIPKRIIEKYKSQRKSDKIFNLIRLSNMCNHFRKLERICGIDHITFHMARHNFGTHITLSQGVPIETVSRMMGHNSIQTTQIYAKITNQKVNEDMKRLKEKNSLKLTVFEDEDMPVGIRLNQNFRSKKNKTAG